MYTICMIAAALAGAPVLGGLLAGVDRKLTARMQGRVGPPILQPFYDVIKLFGKKSASVSPLAFVFVILTLTFTALAVVIVFTGYDLLLAVFSFTLACMFFVLMGYAGYSPYGVIGAERELIQVMCYEPMVLIAAFGVYKASGTFALLELTDGLLITKLPLIFLGLLFVLTVKLRKSPFDLSMSHHGHQELVKGITTELTGFGLGVTEITHWYETVFSLSLVFVFFYNANDYRTIGLGAAVCAVVYFIEIVIDNVFARIKWRPALKSSWLVTAAAGILNFAVLAAEFAG